MKKCIVCLCLILTASIASAQREEPPKKVTVAKVAEREVAENTELIGVLYYDRVSRISTEVAGLVASVGFREGDRVKRGAPLLNISTDFLDKDKALEEMRIQQINVRIEKTLTNLQRYKDLFKIDAASEIDYDNLNFSHQEMLKEREVLRRSLDKINLQRAKCEIRAPFDGIILEKAADIGDWVNPGGMLFRIGSTEDLLIKVPVAEHLVRYAGAGEPVDVVIAAYGEKLVGRISGILPIADEKTKNVFLKIRLVNIREIPFPLAENMSATVHIPVSDKKKLKMIPRDALVRFQGKDFIYTVKDGKAAMLPVHIVSYRGTALAVDDPHIAPGMSVVVDGNERLRPDEAVVIEGEN